MSAQLNGLAFAKDSSGNWGYKVGGADPVIPFKNKYKELDFSSITDAQIAEIVSALDAGTITTNDLSWKVGDERTVHLSAMPATYVYETQPKQDVTFVIYNIGGITLTNGKKCHYVVGMKNALINPGYMFQAYWSSGWASSWKDSDRRKWCNEVFRNAIPVVIRNCFKQFKCITATESNSNTITTTDDYFALPAEKEIFGSRRFSIQAEADALTQFEWYKQNSNKIKLLGENGNINEYWTRSPSFLNDDYSYCCTFGINGNNISGIKYFSSRNIVKYNTGISPFGCI